MKTDLNLANAVVILGALFFIYKSGFSWWILFLIFFAVGAWAYQYTDKNILKMQKDEIEARINNIRAQNAEIVARTLNVVESTKHIAIQRMHYEDMRERGQK